MTGQTTLGQTTNCTKSTKRPRRFVHFVVPQGAVA
jgi:hypothetical protein